MTALFEKKNEREDESFFIGIFQDNLEKSSWHYHNNFEISFITEGSGKRIVGDSIEEFQPGDLAFIGPNLPHVWIAAIHEYLMNNYREDVSLEKLAGLINMAEGSLCRFFKMNMGITIFEYLNKIKIEFACKLLMDQNLSITEVCLNSGFNNLSHFNKQFKKTTGVPPSEYRKRFIGLS
jgi:AraC-like DNA-binding protein